MAELEWEGQPARPSLRRAIRHRLRRFDPSLRVVAEGFMAEVSEIDLLAVGGEGEIISIRIGRGGDDRLLFTQALADLSWLQPRLADFLKLAPSLGLEPSAAPRALILCPDFARETEAAINACRPRSIELATYRCLRQQGQLSVLLDPRSPSQQAPIARAPTGLDPEDAQARTEPTSPNGPPPLDQATESEPRSGFRTGLREVDLHIEVDEEKLLD
jgi:hypothetical protein